jgi:uncharacterized protein
MSDQQRRALYTMADTGPLVALVANSLPEHERIVAALKELPKRPLITTWPCLTEAMYLLHREEGQTAQDTLWGYVLDGLVLLHDLSSAEQQRMRELMKQYADTPMDLADASLVAVAESLGLRQVFTLDSDFYLYRLADGSVLDVIP